MKNAFLSGLVLLAATASQAASFTCTTNVDATQGAGETKVTISKQDDRVQAAVVTDGGMAHFMTQAKVMDVQVQSSGPEVLDYSNFDEGLDLTVDFHRQGGEVRGTLSTDFFPQFNRVPVVCAVSE